MKNSIGIVGGVGPVAGTLLHAFVNEAAVQAGARRDQEHPSVIHISHPAGIPDRTAFLNRDSEINPAEGAFAVASAIAALSSQFGRVVLGVPCNTFHAPAIWDRFTTLIQEQGLNVEPVNMIDATISDIAANHPNVRRIGLMSTTGTRNSGIYRNPLTEKGLQVLEVEDQDALHRTIYDPEFGIKAITPVSDQARSNFEGFAQELIDKGAEVLILGCTEIPLALPGSTFGTTPLVDPMRALAQELVKRAGA